MNKLLFTNMYSPPNPSCLPLNSIEKVPLLLSKVKPLTPLLWIQYAILPFSLQISFLLSLYPLNFALSSGFPLHKGTYSSYQLSFKKTFFLIFLHALTSYPLSPSLHRSSWNSTWSLLLLFLICSQKHVWKSSSDPHVLWELETGHQSLITNPF